EPIPDQMTRPTTMAMPASHAMTPACLMIVMEGQSQRRVGFARSIGRLVSVLSLHRVRPWRVEDARERAYVGGHACLASESKTWIAGISARLRASFDALSPAMTNAERQCGYRTFSNGVRRGGSGRRKLPRLLDVEGTRDPKSDGDLVGEPRWVTS